MKDSMSGSDIRILWDEAARCRGDREFLVFRSRCGGESRYTYGEFDRLINRSANMFRDLGVRKGDTVAVHLCNSIEFMLCLFGLAKIGGIMVPVNEQNLQRESAFVLERCSPRIVVTEPSFLPLYRAIAREDPRLVDTVVLARTRAAADGVLDFDSLIAAQPETLQVDVPLSSEDTVEVLFTSGTTSLPKGVEFTHANLLYSGFYGQWQTGMREDDRLITTMPACHSNFQLAAMMPVIVAGATIIMVEKYSAHRFWGQVREYGATITQCVSMMVRTLLMQPESEEDRCHALREVLYFLPLCNEEKERFEERFGVRLLNSYGSTESLTWVITDFPSGKRKWPSVGRVGIGYEAKVVDDDGAEVPAGCIGEIVVKGVPGRTIMKGYYNDPEATSRTIDPDGWMATGDKGYVDGEGFFYFVDRKANMIKRAGENISSTEIEDALLRSDKVKEAAVIGVPDPVRDQAVKAFVVPADGVSLSCEDVLEYCRANLAAFKVPSFVEIRSELPHTCSMKVEKKLLR